MNTIAALSMTASMKADNHTAVIHKNVQTEYSKDPADTVTLDFQKSPTAVRAAFHNLPVCDPIEISFKDLSYSVQKMFSKSESSDVNCIIYLAIDYKERLIDCV